MLCTTPSHSMHKIVMGTCSWHRYSPIYRLNGWKFQPLRDINGDWKYIHEHSQVSTVGFPSPAPDGQLLLSLVFTSKYPSLKCSTPPYASRRVLSDMTNIQQYKMPHCRISWIFYHFGYIKCLVGKSREPYVCMIILYGQIKCTLYLLI